MRKIKLVVVFLLCIIFLCSCNEKKYSDGELTARNAGSAYSDWEEATTGSVKYLDGSTVLVSIFMEDKNALWTSIDEELVHNNLDIACDYLVEEGKRYGKDVNLIYDTEEYSDLEYHLDYNKAFPGSTDDDTAAVDDFVNYVYEYIYNEISVEDIMKKYHVNSVGFLIFIDGEADAATAYNYHYGPTNYYYEEIAFINLRWDYDRNVNPDTYAHEILHMFGARDLYYTDAGDGISRDFVDYVAEEYSKDIMLGYATKGVSWEDKITSQITDITAYFIGWKDYISELDDFPEIKAKYPASFTQDDANMDEYEEYMLESRKMDEKYFKKYVLGKVLQVAVFIFFVISIVRDVIINKKNRELLKTQYYNSSFMSNDDFEAFNQSYGQYNENRSIYEEHDKDI